MINSLIDKFQAKFPPNRLCALAMAILLPTVIAPAAGYIAVWVPAHFPEAPTFTVGQLTAFGITGFGAALLAGVTAGYKWIDGWQKDEGRTVLVAAETAQQEHEQLMAVLKADSPIQAREVLEEFRGRPLSAEQVVAPTGGPSVAVGATVPPPPPPAPPEQTIPVPRPDVPSHGGFPTPHSSEDEQV